MLMDADEGFTQPHDWRGDPYGPIVYSFDRGNVHSVYVDGRLRYHKKSGPADDLLPTGSEIHAAVAALRARKETSP